MISCETSNNNVLSHFPEVRKIVNAGATTKKISDYKLSRYACYLIVMNGNPQKEIIALAQTYFAIQTRKQELSELEPEERELFLEDLGIKESGLDKIIKLGYKLLGQISFLTAGEKECRAWTITKGTKAPGAAGKIHTDFEKGFIRAEVVPYDTLLSCGGYVGAKEKGKVRIEGKDYIVQDGDVMLFRFNV